jgi:N-acetyl-anhydromuramyl-L-alanine amidase AmpD
MAENNAFAYPPFDQSVVEQIGLRQIYLGNNPDVNNNPRTQQWKFNNSSWMRLASSVNLDISTNKEGILTGNAVKLIKNILPGSNPLDYAGDKLAKSFVLYGGVSELKNETINQQETLVSNLRSLNTTDYFINTNSNTDLINNFTYGFGGISQGIRPMPGIKSINITYLNRGTNARAEVEIIAFTREQLAIIEALYLHPGYNILLEWGHALYIDNKTGNIVQQDYNNTNALTKLFSGKQFDVGTMARIINNDSLARSGNYEGMFGPISNFNYKFNPDGTYTITVYMQSVGLLSESLKLNTSSANAKYQPNVSTALSELTDQLEKEKAELAKIEAERATAQYDLDPNQQAINEDKRQSDNTNQIVIRGPKGPQTNNAFKQENAVTAAKKVLAETQAKYDKLKNAEPTSDNVTSYLKFANILNYWLDIQRQTMDSYTTDNITPDKKTYDLVYADKGLYRKGFATSTKNQKQELNKKDSSITVINEPGTETYIRLGTLLQFISNNLLIYNAENTGLFTIDYAQANNFCTRHKYSMSGDPTICVVQNPDISVGKRTTGGEYTVEDFLDSKFPFKYNSFLGYTMNIFVNLNFAAVASVQNVDSDGNVSLFNYLKQIMNGVKSSLGYVNDWEVSYDSLRNKITIKELAYIKSGDPNIGKRLAKFNIYGFEPATKGYSEGSFVNSVDFNVTLDSKFQANAVTNANSQGEGGVLGEDTTAMAVYNRGLIDRTFKSKFSQNLIGLKDEDKTPDKFNKEEIEKLNSLATSFYGATQSIDTEKIGEFTGVLKTVGTYLVSYQTKTNKRTPKTVIPFDLSLSMMGLGGVKLFEKYTADKKVLPPNFDDLNFIVKAVSHTITDNQWITKIQSLAVAAGNETTYKDDTLYAKAVLQSQPNVASGNVWTGNEPQFKSRPTVNSIILHITDGNPSSTAQQTVDFVGGYAKANQLKASGFDWWNKSGIHYAVDRSGNTAAGVPELKISVHGDNWNTLGVGIEVVGAGSAINVNGTTGNSKSFPTIKIDNVIDLGFTYNNSRYTQELTDPEIASLEKLIKEIISRYPNIQKGITGQNLWKQVFGLKDGKPKINSTVKTQPAKNYKQYGIFAHATGGGNHTDIQPTPKIVAMLKRLGYTE